MRIGQGFDSHRFGKDRELILGGIKIEHEFGLIGHSDADVVAHAIIDSLLGALALGDIGELFPDNDVAYKNIDSMLLLKKVFGLIKQKNFMINNLDVTIICEQPKLSKFKEAMAVNIASALETEKENISIKAKTAEKMGPIGNNEGIMCLAVVLLKRN